MVCWEACEFSAFPSPISDLNVGHFCDSVMNPEDSSEHVDPTVVPHRANSTMKVGLPWSLGMSLKSEDNYMKSAIVHSWDAG